MPDGACSIVSDGPEATRELGERLGRAAQAGDVFLLEGEFGAGKTVLVQGLARGLHVTDEVTSPSFVIVHQHQGRLPLYHLDLYRAERLDPELEETVADVLAAGGVCAVEWPGLLPPELREGASVVTFERGPDDCRRIELRSPRPALLDACTESEAEARPPRPRRGSRGAAGD